MVAAAVVTRPRWLQTLVVAAVTMVGANVGLAASASLGIRLLTASAGRIARVLRLTRCTSPCNE